MRIAAPFFPDPRPSCVLAAHALSLPQALKTLGVNKKQELPIKLFEVRTQLKVLGAPIGSDSC